MSERFRRFILNLPVGRKLTLMVLATCGVILVLAAAVFFAFQIHVFKLTFARDTAACAELVASTAAGPVSFGDETAGRDLLEVLKKRPEMLGARIRLADGSVFVQWGDAGEGWDDAGAAGAESRFRGADCWVAKDITFKGEELGRLYLRANFGATYNDLLILNVLTIGGVLVASFLIALALSSRLQRMISRPLGQLSDVARRIERKEDYGLRAEKAGQDEIGQLADAFNAMVARIQGRDAALREVNVAMEKEIKERRKTEEELLLSRQRYEVAMMGSSDGLWDWDLGTNEVYFSPRWKSIIGFKDDEFENRLECFKRVVHPDDWARLEMACEDYLAGRSGTFETEFRLRHKDGSFRWVLSRGAALRDSAGKPFRFAGSHTDISDRKEEAEREKSRALRALESQSTLLRIARLDGVEFGEQIRAILRESSRFLKVERVGFWNLRADGDGLEQEEMFHLSRDCFEAEGMVLTGEQIPEYFEELGQGLSAISANDVQASRVMAGLLESYFMPRGITAALDAPVARNGKVLGVLCFEQVGMAREWTQDDGEFARSVAQQVALALETRERKRAEASLRESEVRYRSVVESVNEVIFQASTGGEFTFLNSAWFEVTGYNLEGSLGRPVVNYIDEEDRPRWKEALQCVLSRKKESCRGAVRLRHAGGEIRWAEVLLQLTLNPAKVAIGVSGTLTDITERKRAESELEQMHRRLMDASRQAGMAEVATGVLHNVGNVLNSANVSANLVHNRLRSSKVSSLARVNGLLREHEGNSEAFFTTHPQGKMLPGFLIKLTDHLVNEQKGLLEEIASLTQNLEHIKEIVAMQQNYARVSGVIESLQPEQLMEDALRMNEDSLSRHQVELVREYSAAPKVAVDKHKVLQILVNLVRNAKYAVDHNPGGERRIIARIETGDGDRVRLAVRDTGMGIPAGNLTRIFQHGFTTKRDGHGFGLHSGANAAREMGGSLTAYSDGEGKGATFVLELPIAEGRGN